MKRFVTWSAMAVVAIVSLLGSISRGQEKKDLPLGANARLGGIALMPEDSPWRKDISKEAVDPMSDKIIARIGANKPLHPDFGTTYQGAPSGIQYVVVDKNQKSVPVKFRYPDESDKEDYPIPKDAPIEGGPNSKGDRHVLVLCRDRWKLWEVFDSHPNDDGSWTGGSGAIWDLTKNQVRPAGWTSADAAGLPILPGLVRYDEAVQAKAIEHAIRVTVTKTRRAYLPPASHWASRSYDEDLAPMGMRLRLKADFDTSKYPAECQVILKALQKYGMIVADNGGDWFISGAPDPDWNDDRLRALKKVKGRDFEVIEMKGLVADKKRK